MSGLTARCAELPAFAAAFTDAGFFTDVLDGLNDGVYLVDRARTIRFWNRGCERITGYPAGEVVGRRCFENLLRHVDQNGCQLCVGMCPLAQTMRDGQPRQTRVWLHHKRGHRLPVRVEVKPARDPDGQIIGAIETFIDDSPLTAVQDRVAELEQLAMVDKLTGVPNRRFLELTLSGRLAELRRYGTPFVLAFGDIDGFKQVNDVLGHEKGDAVLQMIAMTLAGNLHGSDTVARFGGEEFVLLLHHTRHPGSIAACERLRKLVASSSLDAPSGPISVTISFGATLARPSDTLETLLHRADRLLYHSKRQGRDRTTTDLD